MTRLTLDFFHDVVCGWCFNISPRLHRLAQEVDLDIRHRCFVLQDSPRRMEEAACRRPRR
ncbi:MAG: DsbA family protein [Pseudodonghicola sp.]